MGLISTQVEIYLETPRLKFKVKNVFSLSLRRKEGLTNKCQSFFALGRNATQVSTRLRQTTVNTAERKNGDFIHIFGQKREHRAAL